MRASPLVHASWISILALLLGLLVVLSVTEVDMVARAPGRLVHTDRVKRISATSSGRVRRLLVADGEFVRVGAPLVELDPEVPQAEIAQLSRRMYEARIKYALYSRTSTPRLDPLVDADGQILKFLTDRIAAEDELQQSRIRVAQQDLQLSIAQVQVEHVTLEKATAAVPLARERLSMAQELVAQKFQSPASAIPLHQAFLEADRQAAISFARLDELKLAVEQRRLRLREAEAEYRRLVAERTQQAYAEATDLMTALSKAQAAAELVTITAVADGTVEQFSKDLLSNFVKAGDPLMLLVPQEGSVEAEVTVRNEDAPYVHVAQAARLKLAAFPFTIYGTAPGSVSLVSREPSSAREGEDKVLRFKIRVRVPSIAKLQGIDVPLRSGMLVEAEILAGRRRPIDILLAPFRSVISDSFSDLR